jgi:hypothetical protein
MASVNAMQEIRHKPGSVMKLAIFSAKFVGKFVPILEAGEDCASTASAAV